MFSLHCQLMYRTIKLSKDYFGAEPLTQLTEFWNSISLIHIGYINFKTGIGITNNPIAARKMSTANCEYSK